mmetsp:Transcript_28776/g.54627  ORF Transcript_28776/g.54627 Transcript_28776/m.54627 type:complete len:380 (-) Transcript_28776:901-2040(-)
MNTSGQQAVAARQGARGPGIKGHCAARLHCRDPAFARRLRILSGGEPCGIGPVFQRGERTVGRTVADRHGTARSGGCLGRHQLGLHPALGQARACIPSLRLNLGGNGVDGVIAFCRRIIARIGGIEPVHIRQEHQHICPDRGRNLGGQPVIVAKADLVRGHGVIFVHNRQGAKADQLAKGRARVQITAAVAAVLQRHQHLRGGDAVRCHGFLIGAGEPDLTHGGGGLRLFQRQIGGGQMQHLAPQRDGAGGHQHHLHPCPFEPGHVLRQPCEPIGAECACVSVHQQGRPDLDDEATGCRQGCHGSASCTGLWRSRSSSIWPRRVRRTSVTPSRATPDISMTGPPLAASSSARFSVRSSSSSASILFNTVTRGFSARSPP